MINIADYYHKLAEHQEINENEIVELLRELDHFRKATSYLASCQAATLEGLPASASKASRSRHAALCDAAAKFIDGDASPIRFREDLDVARKRCLDAAKKYQAK